MTVIPRQPAMRTIGVIATVLIMMVAVVFTIFYMNRRYEAALHPSHEIPWLASQLETEYLRTSQALRLYATDSGVAHDEVVLRFEVYWSRVELMAQGARFADIQDGSWQTLGPALFASLAELDEVITRPGFHQTASGTRAIRNHLLIWPALHAFSQESIRSVWTRNTLQQRRAMITVVTAMAVVLILVVFVAGIMFKMARKQAALASSERVSRELAEASNRERERFMASMSHELRTPLNAIIGFSEVMSLSKFGPLDRKYREYAHDILKSGHHLLGLVNQVLDISSLSERKNELVLSRFRVSQVLDDCMAMVAPLVRGNDLSTHVEVRQDFEIETDVQKFMQIMVNLLSNAVKFTPAHGTITVILAEKADGDIEIAVRDTGIGMTDEVRARVFDPFFRSADPYVSSSEGTGLGLAISREAAGQMGFTLVLESAPGQGTTAALLIPAERGTGVLPESAVDQGSPVQDLWRATSRNGA